METKRKKFNTIPFLNNQQPPTAVKKKKRVGLKIALKKKVGDKELILPITRVFLKHTSHGRLNGGA